MMLRHHPHDETLMSFASGALDEAFAMIVSCHLQFCARCRERVRELEDIGSVLLEGIAIKEGDAGFEQRVMSAFATEFGADVPLLAPMIPDPGDHRIMPAPLAWATGLVRETIPWKPVSPGVQSVGVPASPGAKSVLHFLTLAPGVLIEPELHEGSHFILILWGDYESEAGRVNRGDFHEIDAEIGHSFRAGNEEGVVCIVATDVNALHHHAWAAN